MFITPKMRDSPEAMRNNIMPRDSPLKNCAKTNEASICFPRLVLFGSGGDYLFFGPPGIRALNLDQVMVDGKGVLGIISHHPDIGRAAQLVVNGTERKPAAGRVYGRTF